MTGPAELLRGPGAPRHVERRPARPGRTVPWPDWVDPALVEQAAALGIDRPWEHQVAAASAAHAGTATAIATGTASGKSLALWLPALTRLRADPRATALYLSPTKALARDQVRALDAWRLPDVRIAGYDGDTPDEERRWIRAHGSAVLTNPDLVHYSLLPRHASWSRFLRGLAYVIVDEAHLYRGVFGSHVALVLRRLRRIAARYGADPTFCLASATMADPGTTVARLTGIDGPVAVVTEDAAPRAALTAVLWEPPVRGDAPRSAGAETADLLADLAAGGARTLAFIRSRRGAEGVAAQARADLAEVDADLATRVAAYRGGYLPEERRALEADLRSGRLLGLATTNALESGIDITGLDAVLVAGWPGTRASLWQQWGRAGRDHGEALAVFIPRQDPLDHYLLDHPEAIFGAPVEATVLDPANPSILGPHLAAAAQELPLTPEDAAAWFGATAPAVAEDLAAAGILRRRPTGWYWTRRESAAGLVDLRGSGGSPVRIVEGATGRLLGTVDAGRAHATVHAGAVYVHQGETYIVDALDLDADVALVHPEEVDHSTTAHEIADYRIVGVERTESWGEATLSIGEVDVTAQVVGFERRRLDTGQVIGRGDLDLPERILRTRAVWWTLSDEQVAALAASGADLAGAVHAAEHASIGLLPLIASCDRWDIGGVSTPLHPDTGRCTVMVYDGYPGGAGFAERGFEAARTWLRATRDAIADCRCRDGCPACIQSPKCGNGNEPLDKRGAIAALDALLGG